jgi:hypothetical protein
MFWGMLADFAGMSLCPQEWLSAISSDHPFLAARVRSQDGAPVLMVNRS